MEHKDNESAFEFLINPINNTNLIDTIRAINDKLTNTANEVADILQSPGYGIILQLMSNLAQIATSLLDVKDLDELKKETMESYLKWGEYGWTVIPGAPQNLYKMPPENIKEANSIAGKYCTKIEIQNLFDSIRQHKCSEKNIEEAFACYTNRRYKACSLLLCTLIEGKLVKITGRSNMRGKRRPVGYKAANILNEEIKEDEEIPWKERLYYSNLFCYLLTLFQDGGDFKQQPEILNRNFITHGMYLKPVRKRDCIQLFLAYYHLLDYLDYLHRK